MADPILEIDAAGSNVDGTNPGSALTITTGNYGLTLLSPPAPPERVQWASSVDTEGSLAATAGYENRMITVGLDVTGDAALNALTAKLAKLHREGGTLKHTGKDGTVVIADVLATGGYEPAYDHTRLLGDVTQVTFTLPAKPYVRAPESDLGDNVETTLPVLIFSDSILGDVEALGRLVIDNDSSADWWQVQWGAEDNSQYTHTTSSGSGGLFYEAESRTALGGAAIATVTGASGGGANNAVSHTGLTTVPQAILSTQATGGGAHLTHVGIFNVRARVQVPAANTGTVSLQLVWRVGDTPALSRNPAVSIADLTWASDMDTVWRTVDLGMVTIHKTTGTHAWEGRILASSTVLGDDVSIDYLALFPVASGSGVASAVPYLEDPTTFSARDEFDQTAGALAAKVLPVGGTWAGAGDADDFTVNATTHTAQRTAVSDTTGALSNGRWAIAGSTNYTNIYVQLSGSYTAATLNVGWGVFARRVDANNYLAAVVYPDFNLIHLQKTVAGTLSTLAGLTIPSIHPATITKTIRLQVDDQGRAFVWFGGRLVLVAQHDDLATGGALATGTVGFVDHKDSAGASTRTYDDFYAAVPVKDAAVYAGQSLELRHDRVNRENSGGTAWSRVSSPEGDYLRLLPARTEGRSLRVIVHPCRNDPEMMSHPAIDDVSARLFATARYLTFPD